MESVQTSGTGPMMSLPQAVKQVLRKYAVFSGRATRAEYWWWVLATVILGAILSSIDSFVFSLMEEGWGTGPFNAIYNLAILLPSLAVTVRRLHDIDKSGWWVLTWFVIAIVGWMPFVVGLVALLVSTGSVWEFEASGWIPLVVGLAITLLIELGLLVWAVLWMARQGGSGPNSYGPDPGAVTGQETPAADALA